MLSLVAVEVFHLVALLVVLMVEMMAVTTCDMILP